MITGYQAVYDKDFFDAIDYADQNEFDFVSFDLHGPRFYIDALSDRELDRIRSYAEGKRVGLALHSPGDNVSLYADFPAVRRGILEHFSAIIAAAEKLNVRHITLHAGAYPSFRKTHSKDEDFLIEHRDYFGNVLYENVMHLVDQSKNVMLCIENFNFQPYTMGVVGRLLSDTERLFLTWDIAKTYDINIQRNDAVEEFMWKHKDRIREIHAHDIIKDFRSHQTVGDGGIDFMPYAELFVRPDIAVTFEVRPREAAKVSRDNLTATIHPHS